MPGMLQIITYLLAFYLVVKGIEVLQIALASNRDKRRDIITIGVLTLIACVIAALVFAYMQAQQAHSISQSVKDSLSRSLKP